MAGTITVGACAVCCGGSTITTPCCPSNPISSVLHLTWSGACAGLVGATLTWNGSAWVGTDTGTCALQYTFFCTGGGFFALSIAGCSYTNVSTSLVCSPFHYHAQVSGLASCCAGCTTGTLDITI